MIQHDIFIVPINHWNLSGNKVSSTDAEMSEKTKYDIIWRSKQLTAAAQMSKLNSLGYKTEINTSA